MQMMNRAFVALALVLALSFPALSAEGTEPCVREFAAAALVANLQDISMTTNALGLLNGQEDPKLRRLLERRLAIAAAEARYHIGLDPVIQGSSMPSLAGGVSCRSAFSPRTRSTRASAPGA